ncbi:MAG TPA: adenosine deaminase [Saprospiraceae bacterium]|nr:adenosine deaminase [Saprospiraceae bacterium]
MKTGKYLHHPKIELHLHLDCSLGYNLVKVLEPAISYKEFRKNFVAPSKCKDLSDYLKRAKKAVSLLQDITSLQMATENVFDQLQADQVIYAEIRFAPLLHIQKGLKPEEVVEAVEKATLSCIRNSGIEARLILCTLRNFSKEQSMQTVRLASLFKGSLVVGFDIAGDEAGWPLDAHIPAFQWARERNINTTAHTGEAKGFESVWETISVLQPHRLGHGIRSNEDPELLEYIRENDIHLEICPTSNVQTHTVDAFHNHPIHAFAKMGLSLSINTDGRTLSRINLSREYDKVATHFGWTSEQFLQCNLEAIRHAFLEEPIKDMLRKRLVSGYSGE